jgi:hypothetical protein
MTKRSAAIESVKAALTAKDWEVWPGSPSYYRSKCECCTKGRAAVLTAKRGESICTRVILRMCLSCAEHTAAQVSR